jgi:hypothetical protein
LYSADETLINGLTHLPLITTLTRLQIKEAVIDVIASLAHILPLMTSLRKLTIETEKDHYNDAIIPPRDLMPTICLPPSLHELIYAHHYLPIIVAKGLTFLSIDYVPMGLIDLMKQFPDLDHAIYGDHNQSKEVLTFPQPPPPMVKWKSFKAALSSDDLYLVLSMSASLTSIALDIAFPSFDHVGVLLMNLTVAIEIDLEDCSVHDDGVKGKSSATSLNNNNTNGHSNSSHTMNDNMIKLPACQKLVLFGINQQLVDRLVLPNLKTFVLHDDGESEETEDIKSPPPIDLTRFLFIDSPSLTSLGMSCPFTLIPTPVSSSLPPLSSSLLSTTVTVTDEHKRSNEATTTMIVPSSTIHGDIIAKGHSLLSLTSLCITFPLDNSLLGILLSSVSHTLQSLEICELSNNYTNMTLVAATLLQLTSVTCINCEHNLIIEFVRLLPNLCQLTVVVDKPNGDEPSLKRKQMVDALPSLADIDFSLMETL